MEYPLISPSRPYSLPPSLPLPPPCLTQELARLENALGDLQSSSMSRDEEEAEVESRCIALSRPPLHGPARRPSDMFGLPAYASASGQRAGAAPGPPEATGNEAALSQMQTLFFTSLPA